jgi:hypothetical protein
MALVFCRGCGKQIHESALTCPGCGAPQKVNSSAASARGRNPVALIGMAFVWTAAFWMTGLILAGAVAGMLHPSNASKAGEAAGEALAFPLMLLALPIAAVLTIAGRLPGTRRGGQ